MPRAKLTALLFPVTGAMLKSPLHIIGNSRFQLATRSFSTKRLSPAVSLISNAPTKHLKSRPNLTEYSSEGRPLSILICWLAAKNNAVNKYAKFYLEQGFDVMTVRITPWQLLLPARAEPAIRNEIIPALLTSDHEKKLIHGFSVGGYVFGQMLNCMHNDPTGKGQELMKTMKAQIWDSPVDVNGISIGVSKSLFVNYPFFQKSMQAYIDFHMRAFYDIATKYYEEAHEYYYNQPLQAPALFLASAVDQISTLDAIQDVQKLWNSSGITCSNMVWNNTSHVGHMRRYPEEYKLTIKMFLDGCGFKRGAPGLVREEVQPTFIPHGNMSWGKTGTVKYTPRWSFGSFPSGIMNHVYVE